MAINTVVLRSNPEQTSAQGRRQNMCVAELLTHNIPLAVGSSRCTFRHLVFFSFHLHVLTHVGHVGRITGLPTSQYTNMCFPLHALNNASPHLLLAHRQPSRLTNIQYIWRVWVYICVSAILQCRGARKGDSCWAAADFGFIIQIRSSYFSPSSSSRFLWRVRSHEGYSLVHSSHKKAFLYLLSHRPPNSQLRSCWELFK